MDKSTFLKQLQKRLSSLPQEDIAERLHFYNEMIDDYVEEGLTEDEAIARIGSVNDITADISPAVSKRHHPGKITAIVLGSPIWLSLLISAFGVVFSVYVSMWAVIVSLWSVFSALAGCSFAGLVCGIGLAVTGYVIPGIALFGTALVCGGLSVFTFYGCKAATKGIILLTKKIAHAIRNRIKKKEGVHYA